jgi:hypothetical protein
LHQHVCVRVAAMGMRQEELERRIDLLEVGLRKNGGELSQRDQELVDAQMALKAQVRRAPIARLGMGLVSCV